MAAPNNLRSRIPMNLRGRMSVCYSKIYGTAPQGDSHVWAWVQGQKAYGWPDDQQTGFLEALRHNLVSRSFKSLLKHTGLPDIRFHDLRHTCASLMLAVGTNPKVVQETLGHANVSVTLDTYSHLLPNMQEEAAQKINELLS